jgi:hypothetical protein
MRSILALLLIPIIYSCAGSKDKSAKGDVVVNETVSDNDFTNQFENLGLKFMLSDTALDRMAKEAKPLAVAGKDFFPDSLVRGYFGAGAKPKYYAVGKVQNGDSEMYVIMRAVTPEKRAAFLLCYDDQLRYKDGVLFCQTDSDPKTNFWGVIDKDYNIKVVREERNGPDDVVITDQNMVYNASSGKLMMAVNNNPEQDLAIINPIDTLPQTRKYAGDYGIDKSNYISVRDGKDSSEFLFFYVFKKGGDGCEGEIKGKGTYGSGNMAQFRQDGDPCVINFTFTNSQVTVKEDHGCGNYRGLDCKFDGVYPKKKKTGSQPEMERKKKEKTTADNKTGKTDKEGKPVKPATDKNKPAAKKAPVTETQEQ